MTTHMHRTNKSDFSLVIWVVNQHVRKITYLIRRYNDIPITFFYEVYPAIASSKIVFIKVSDTRL
jgi:hypothetical protein